MFNLFATTEPGITWLKFLFKKHLTLFMVQKSRHNIDCDTFSPGSHKIRIEVLTGKTPFCAGGLEGLSMFNHIQIACRIGVSVMLNRWTLMPVIATSHKSNCFSASFQFIFLLMDWESSWGWPKLLGPCTQVENLQEAPGSWLLTQLQSLWHFG